MTTPAFEGRDVSSRESGPAAAYRALVRRRMAIILGLAVCLAVSVLADLMLGPARYGALDVIGALVWPGEAPAALKTVVWDIRLPTALMAVVTGASLAIAGAQMQTILDNPLASPFTLGISAAAGFGASVALAFGVSILPYGGSYVVPANAFVTAMAAALLINGLSRARGVTSETVILLGIALGFTFNALLSLVQFLSSDQALAAIVFWTMGNLTRASWEKVAITGGAVALTIPFFVHRAWAINTLRLGDDKAASYGVDVASLRLQIMLLVALLAAVPVSFVGTIGFIGLVGPHIARMLVGEDQRFFLPASALAGATLLSAASVASKALMPGLVFPISIVTALVGIPFFVSLILSNRRGGR